MAILTSSEALLLIVTGDAPTGIHVDGDLDLRGTEVTVLPDGLAVGGHLLLGRTPITALPDGLTVGGDLILYGAAITALPARLAVGRSLYLSGTAITALPEDVTVGGHLDLYATAVTALPNGLNVGGNLDISWTAITALPERLTVGGGLYLRGTTIIELPACLTLGGDLFFSAAETAVFPSRQRIAVALGLRPNPGMRFPTAWFRRGCGGERWRALATDGDDTLYQSDGNQFTAHCRGPWSLEEALAHWGNPARSDRRAKLFAAALRKWCRSSPAPTIPKDMPMSATPRSGPRSSR